MTASIQEVKADFLRYTDILAPLISQMHGTSQMPVGTNGKQYEGNQRHEYKCFLEPPGKEVWLYTSCIAVACIGETDPGENKITPDWEGWADYTIDAAASQNRAMGWLAYLYDVSGELYYAVDQRLAIFDEKGTLVSTAWTDQWFAGGNGDGTLFYPWDKDRVGGETPIPIESMRMKLIRNGHQDYEYLRLAGLNNKGEEALSIARKLYPSTFDTIATDAEVDAARRELAGLAEGVKGRVTPLGSLSVTPTESTVGNSMTASFTVTNDGGNPIDIKYLLTGARDSKGINVDFPSTAPLTLQPGHSTPTRRPARSPQGRTRPGRPITTAKGGQGCRSSSASPSRRSHRLVGHAASDRGCGLRLGPASAASPTRSARTDRCQTACREELAAGKQAGHDESQQQTTRRSRK